MSESFQTTQWSIVLAAGLEPGVAQREALSSLCQVYWYPLYAYVRRRGYSEPDAQDLTQGFFADLLERRDIQSVRPELGRFRSFLLTALKNFMANEYRKESAEHTVVRFLKALVSYSNTDSGKQLNLLYLPSGIRWDEPLSDQM